MKRLIEFLSGICAALLLASLTGCSGLPQGHSFPDVWPSAIDYQPSGEPLPEQTGPILSVSFLQYGGSGEGSGETTAVILTDLLIQRLQQKGVAARSVAMQQPLQAAEQLNCVIERLSYLILPKYPRTVKYEAQLSCALTLPGAARARWTQKLAQRYEVQTVFNTMTKLSTPYEQTLYRQCIVPLWDAMAVSLKTYLDHAPAAELSVTAPEAPAVRQIYSK